MRDTQLITYTVDKLLKDSYFKQGVCRISVACSGGGGAVSSVNGKTGTVVLNASDISTTTTPSQTIQQALDGKNLQTVTNGTGNNITSNAIQVTGTANINPAINSSVLGNIAGIATEILNVSNGETSVFLLGSEGFNIQCNNKMTLIANEANTTPFTFYKDLGSNTLSTVSGADGVENNDFVTLQQLKANTTPNQVVTGALPSANLVAGTYYTYTGNTNTSWDLPQVSGNTGTRIAIINTSANSVTVNGFSGANEIYTGGAVTSSTIIGSGEITILYNNSIYWVAIV